MNLLPLGVRERRKAAALRRISLRLAPPDRANGEFAFHDFRRLVDTGTRLRWPELEAFLDFCVADRDVRDVMESAGLDRHDLKDLYMRLSAAGLNRWIGEHFAALATLAYPETLLYVLRSRRMGLDARAMKARLERYWRNVAAHGRDAEAVAARFSGKPAGIKRALAEIRT